MRRDDLLGCVLGDVLTASTAPARISAMAFSDSAVFAAISRIGLGHGRVQLGLDLGLGLADDRCASARASASALF